MAKGLWAGELNFYEAVTTLLPHQRKFIGAPQSNVAYVGGVGSGKSIGLCLAAILNGHDDPNGFSLVGRLNMPALQDSTMKTFLELVLPHWGDWKPSEKRYTLKNGHEFIFRHLDTTDPKVSGHIKSMNLSGAYIDEATEVSEDIYYLILSRIRRKNCKHHVIRLASNPAGHDWVWRHFFDVNRKPALLKSNLGITASTFDNVHLPKQYMDNMLSTYPPDWAERYLYGSFADFSDLIYKEFSDRTHVWNSQQRHACFGNDFLPPRSWPVIVGIDIGSDAEHDPWAICLISVGPDGSLFQFDEVYGRGLLIAEIATQVHQKLAGRIPDMAYDYSNRQCAMELAEHDIHGQPAIKEVRPGLFKTAQYMHMDERLSHPFIPQKGAPRYYVASHCHNTIRELTGYKYAKDRSGNSTEDPAHENSHMPDAIRYAIHTFRPLPEKMKPPAAWENPALDELSRLYWYEEAKKQAKKYPERGSEPMTAAAWETLQSKTPARWRRPGSMRFRRSAV